MFSGWLTRVRLIASASFAWLTLSSGAFAEWRQYENPKWHYRIAYPQYLFQPPVRDDAQGGITLLSEDGEAQLFIFGGMNRDRENPVSLAHGLGTLDDVHEVTYRRVASDWLVLSGYLADSGNIFYERVELSRNGERLAGFRLEYPATQRPLYDHLIGQIGRSLRPTS